MCGGRGTRERFRRGLQRAGGLSVSGSGRLPGARGAVAGVPRRPPGVLRESPRAERQGAGTELLAATKGGEVERWPPRLGLKVRDP